MSISIVTNEDNMAMMARYPDKYFDLAIVDPPYGIGCDSDILIVKPDRPSTKHRKEKYPAKEWDNKTPNKNYFIELIRVSKNQIIWGGNYFIENLYSSKGWVFWNKLFDKTFNFSHGELAWTSFNKQLMMFTMSSKAETNGGKERMHPTQKPVALYTWILQNYAITGDKILDTHLGSGSSRIAAYDLGFDFYGCELDKDYFDAQEKRFAKQIAQQKLFAPHQPTYKQTTLL